VTKSRRRAWYWISRNSTAESHLAAVELLQLVAIRSSDATAAPSGRRSHRYGPELDHRLSNGVELRRDVRRQHIYKLASSLAVPAQECSMGGMGYSCASLRADRASALSGCNEHESRASRNNNKSFRKPRRRSPAALGCTACVTPSSAPSRWSGASDEHAK
jgi:hypothetical protein